MIATLFAFALAAAPAAGGCAPQSPDACRDAGELVRDPAFQAQLRRFVGERPTRYFSGGGRAYGETLAVLSGPADPVQRIGGLYLFGACRDQSCEEKGAVALDPDGQIVAVGVLHTECAKLLRTRDCFQRDTFSIFTVKGQEDQPVVESLSDWARRQVAADAASPGEPATRLARIEVIGSARPPEAAPAPKLAQGPAAAPRLKASASGKEAKVAEALTELAKQQAEAPRPQRQAQAAVHEDAAKPQKLAQLDAPAAPPPPAAQPEPATQAAAQPAPAAKPKPKPAKPKAGWFSGWKWRWTPYD